jgi:PQQ-dependent dehydrogenase (methanol/ethanol family)
MGGRSARAFTTLLAVLVAACGPQAERERGPAAADAGEAAAPAAPVDDARLIAAGSDASSWLTYGRDYFERRYSPLAQVGEHNVARLGLAWSFDMETTRGVEATPLVIDGVMYVSGPWSVVYALDARTGALRWKWDPGTTRARARLACCDVINRGVAAYAGKIYVGTLDGRLVALDAASGSVVWDVQTFDPAQPYTITGAPRVVRGLVVIGSGGAEYGVRGYVAAYDARTGTQVWRTYTVPGNPANGFESPALERAATTWSGEWWKLGGGGTVWDAMAFDPELDLLYVGTGNGSPHVRRLRSPGGGDNWYLSSILALRPATGELVWHFQTTPADNWDYTSTQHILLADLEIDGRPRKVLMQAPKNGFFWVIDRATGEFISAAPFVRVTWATGVDPRGRPIEAPEADYGVEGRILYPSPFGGHNWHPMAFHPRTGLVYVPAQDMPSFFKEDASFSVRTATHNTGIDYSVFSKFALGEGEQGADARGYLLAWDPVRQREVWRVPHVTVYNGGALATGGNLVFQGSADGRFAAYRATDGEKLWESPAGTGIMAGPITYELDGVQYVAVAAGWGSGFALSGGPLAAKAGVRGAGRVLAFALDRHEAIPAAPPAPGPVPEPHWPFDPDPEQIARGEQLYAGWCMACHGPLAIGGGSIPDLRYSSPEVHEQFADIVLGGLRSDRGMPPFGDALSAPDARAIQAYVLHLAEEAAIAQR